MPSRAPLLRRRSEARLFPGLAGALARVGLAVSALGSCLLLYLEILLGRERLDLPGLAYWLRVAGRSALLPITLVAAALGLIIGIQTEAALVQADLPGLVLGVIGYTVVRQLVPVLVGVLVAGRAGVALATRQAAMIGSGEVDGLLVCGVDPIRFTLGPALLAMLAMSVALSVWATLVTLGCAFFWLQLDGAISAAQLAEALSRALEPPDLADALLKALAFALVVALLATVNGTTAGREPGSVGAAATRTMIGAVTAILLLDLAFTLLPRI